MFGQRSFIYDFFRKEVAEVIKNRRLKYGEKIDRLVELSTVLCRIAYMNGLKDGSLEALKVILKDKDA